jgi:hypothetical protein
MKKDETAIDVIVLIRNHLPTTKNPAMRSGILSMTIIIPVGSPESLFIIIATPLIPPGASALGERNNAIPSEYITQATSIIAQPSMLFVTDLFIKLSPKEYLQYIIPQNEQKINRILYTTFILYIVYYR